MSVKVITNLYRVISFVTPSPQRDRPLFVRSLILLPTNGKMNLSQVKTIIRAKSDNDPSIMALNQV